MLRTKKDVDRHVQDIFCKLPDENERSLRCYKIGELYYNVGDYESARRYLSRYIEVRKEAKAHKLMGQILEARGQKDAALVQYKFAFELDSRQEDLVLKVCELMADPDVGIDVNRAKYWVERADKYLPRHKVVFQLKEKILSIERPTNNEQDLENLITAELTTRPTDVQLRVKLLKHYMDKSKFDEAYKHATDIEATNMHRDSLLWYQILCELFLKCKSNKQLNWSFWIMYISSLERYAALSLKEQGSVVKKTSEAIQAVYNFDQHLFEAKAQSFSSYPSLTESIFLHMWGQLHFHMACLLLQNTKREQSSWSEAGRLSAPLLLTAVHIKPIDLTASWATHLDSQMKNQLQLWYREGSYRCSQAGHVLHDYSKGNQKKLISNIEKFCTGSWRERVYQRIFVGKIYQKVRSSYFTNNNALNPPLRLVSHNELKRYDEVAEEVWPYSLHHQIWPAIKSWNSGSLYSSKHEGPQPNLSSHLFPELQFSVYNLNQASPVTLSRLDVDAFLNAAVLCAAATVEEQQRNNLLNPDRLPTLPADLTNTLCTEDQGKWWIAAYKMYCNEGIDDIGDTRQILQRGLEAVRCIGNHGLHPTILVHLSRIFHYRAKQLKEKNNGSSDIPALESRSELYWSAAVPLLERLQNNQTIRTLHMKLFDYIGKDMNNMELTHAIEEGKLLLAQKLVRDKLYEQAIEALQALKCPEASFEQGKIYKKLADESMNCLPKESVTSEMRSQHVIILSKARNCFYLTLDRLRSPDADPKHPLNAELCTHITSVENELKRIDPDTLYTDRNRNDCDDFSEESYSSAHSDEQPIVTNTLPVSNHSMQTPIRNMRRTPRQSSTPRQHNQDTLDLSRNRNEARPSPERLDAQIRQLVHSIESLKEQNREQHRAMISKLDELIRISARKESSSKSRPQPPPVANHNVEEDLYGAYNEEDYRDYNTYSNTSIPSAMNNRTAAGTLAQNLFAQNLASAQRHPYSPLVYSSPAATAAALQGYYQGGHLPFPDPAVAAAAANQHMSGLYPAAAAVAAAGVYPMSPLYRSGLEQPIASMQQMTENVLQHSLFAQRLAGQLPDYSVHSQSQHLVPQQPSLGLQMNDTIKNDSKLGYTLASDSAIIPDTSSLIKDNLNTSTAPTVPVATAARKAPPVNVVITTSDTLPTTVPTVQPMLSVTIPAQHRLGVIQSPGTQDLNNAVPHSYQISMPSQPTIPTTVNLPPLSATLTITSPAMQSRITDNQNSSILSTGSQHSSSDVTEIEHDPIPDFAPIIPLPDEVPVTTGEENEETLFCARAKLFRFVDKEWKERGLGNVKLLKNSEGKVRLLMRREQVLKICANHMLRRDMELTMMPNNDKAYIWVANDFADEELKIEKLCIKFKTAEEAANFKENFDTAKNSLPLEGSSKIAETKVSSSTDSKTTAKPAKAEPVQNKPVEKIGGFTFSSSPIIQKPASTETPDPTKKKPEETAKPSPFASFSFVKSSDQSSTPTDFSFGNTASSAPPTAFGQDSTKTALRRPLAATVTDTAKDTVIRVEDNEIVVCELSINLMHFTSDNKTWKEKGNGIIKLLSEKGTARIRLLMNNEDNTKTIYNQVVPVNVLFNVKVDAVNWTIATDKNKTDTYLARFKNYNQASLFHKAVLNLQQKSSKPASKPANAVAPEQKPLSEMFKPAAGSWECKDCYTRNSATATNCASCQGPAPVSAATVTVPAKAKPTPQSVSRNLLEQFKPPTGSWECKDCYTRNSESVDTCVACKAPAPFSNNKAAPGSIPSTPASTPVVNKPLSEMFKPPSGSWECKACYTCNTQSNQYCAACDAPKDPSMPPKPKTTGGFQINSQTPDTKTAFSFGIPQSDQTVANKESSGFNFSLSSKPSEKAVSSPISIFGSNKSTTPNTSGFLFGAQPPNTPPNSVGGGPFTFGSPGKSFDFQFQAKSPPVKSPERAETSDEDVVEEAEDVYFPPVIPLPDKVDIKTGEENEDVLYSHRAKLFKFDTITKEWKERGLGDIKLLRHTDTKKLRLVMRRDQVLKLCLNHAVSSLEVTPKDDKTWMWSAGDYSEGEIEYMQFACRFKTPEIAEEFKKAIDEACKSNGSNVTSTTTTSTRKDSASDIQIIYESSSKVTAEEKAAALKLQLPEHFYAYKYKDDCPGCIGCRDADKFIFNTDRTKQPAKPSGPIIVKANEVTPATTSQSVFNTFGTPGSGLKMTFGTSTPPVFNASNRSFGDVNPTVKSTSFVFGNQTTAKIDSQEFGLENLKICGPTTIKTLPSITTTTTTASAPSTNIFGGFGSSTSSNTTKSVFGAPSSTATPVFASSIFSAPPGTTANTAPVKNIFGNSKPLFGDTKPLFGDTKPTSHTFGEAKPPMTNIFGDTKLPSTNIFGGTATIVSTTSSIGNSIFGTNTTTTSLFGGQTTVTPTFGSLATQNNTQATQLGTFGTGGFGSAPATNAKPTVPATTAIGGTSLFGGDAAKPFANSTAPLPAANLFGSKPPAPTADDAAKKDGVSFLPTEGSLTFSALIHQTSPTQQPVFQKDPNFTFDGAGASVFGGKSVKKTVTKKTPSKTNAKKDDDDEEGGDEENENGDDHDPYFEPIIPLPDAIEVRTGEEDEEKVFCQRAKLYRFDQNTREWKERGTGEMKLLHHAEHNTYRLLLRREQVHKVVCNLLLTPDLEFRELNTSDRAWVWAGMNYAEADNPEVERLAVKFKTSELAGQFKEAIDKAQRALAERQIQDVRSGYGNNQPDDEYEDDYGEGDDYVDEDEDEKDEDDDEEDDDDDDSHMKMFEKRATLYAQNEGEVTWKFQAMGCLKVIYDSDLFGAKIVVEDDKKQIASESVISIDTSMQRIEKECTWAAIDYALNSPTRRTLRAVFSSNQTSEEMYNAFQEGQECATKADIRE